MASLTITIPDAVLPRVRDAACEATGFTNPDITARNQHVRQLWINQLKTWDTEKQIRDAAATARANANPDALGIT